MVSQAHPVRRATERDIPALTAMLARAFFDDPVARWCCPPDALRMRLLERHQGARVRQMLADDEVWVAGEGACAAMWAPPDRWRHSVREDWQLGRPMLQRRLVARMPMVVAGLLGMERRHPVTPPHWFLGVLGTDPSAQGQGLASAAMAPVLDECDHHGIAAYLESSKETNVGFYARFGFRVIGEHRMPRGGPTLWLMWRDPR